MAHAITQTPLRPSLAHGLEALRGRLEGVRGSMSCTSQLFLVTSSVMVDMVVTEVGAVTVILAQLLAPGPLAE